MLKNGRVATRLPAEDLDRAKAFYAEKLGLEPVDERPGASCTRGCGEFALFGRPAATRDTPRWAARSRTSRRRSRS